MSFATRMRDAMEKADIKPIELARITGIGKASISEYLSGKFEPKQRNIYKIASALNVKPSYLLGISDAEPALPKPVALPQEEQALLDRYRQLDSDGKKRISDMLDFELFRLENSAQKDERNLG